jgi:hypothetical protein
MKQGIEASPFGIAAFQEHLVRASPVARLAHLLSLGRGARAESGQRRRSGDPSRLGQRALFMGIRNDTVETLSETGARRPKRPRRTRSSTSRPRGASPPASMLAIHMLARRSGVSAVAVEASMDNAREEGTRELTESAREFPKAAARRSPNGSLREARTRMSPTPAHVTTSPHTNTEETLFRGTRLTSVQID